MTTTNQPRAGVLAWVGLGLLAIPVFMTAIDMTVLFLATPTIAAELEPTATQQLWMLHIGDLVAAGLVLTAGRLVDRFGPRLLLVLSALAYGGANLLAAYAPSIEMLVGARALIGIAAVSMTPAAMALLRRMFLADRQLSMAVAIFMAAYSGGVALGPPIGGALLEYFWWGSIFLVNVPIALVVVLSARILPRVPGQDVGRIDVTSVLLSLGAIALVVYGGQELAAGTAHWSNAGMVAVGLTLGALFVRRQRRLPNPLLDLGLFRARHFTLGLLAILVVIVTTAGADMQFAQHLQVVLGYSPLTASLLLVVPAVFAIVTTVVASALLRWLRPSVVMGAGVLLGIGGAAVTARLVGDTTPSPVATIAAVTVVAAGLAPVFSISTDIVIRAVPANRTGSAMAGQDVAGSLGNTVGLAIGGTVAFLGYRARLSGTLPSGLDAGSRDLSLQGIGPAHTVADGVPAGLGAELRAAATEAFAGATRDTYVFAAVGLVALAILVFWGLRHARVDSSAGEVPQDDVAASVGDESDSSATARGSALSTANRTVAGSVERDRAGTGDVEGGFARTGDVVRSGRRRDDDGALSTTAPTLGIPDESPSLGDEVGGTVGACASSS